MSDDLKVKDSAAVLLVAVAVKSDNRGYLLSPNCISKLLIKIKVEQDPSTNIRVVVIAMPCEIVMFGRLKIITSLTTNIL